MQALYVIGTLFFLTPFLLGCIAQLSEWRGYVSNGRIAKPLRSLDFALALLVYGTSYLGMLLTGYKYFAGDVYIQIPIAVLTVNSIATIALSLIFYRAVSTYKKFSFPIKAFFTLATLWVTWMAGSFAGNYITETTGLSVTELPSAAVGLTLLYAPILWALVMSFAFLILYGFTGLLLIVSSTKPSKEEQPFKFEKRFHIIMALMIGLGILATSSTEIIRQLTESKWLKDIQTQILIFSGYTLSKHSCAKSAKESDRFTILSSGEIAIAQNIDEGKFKYFVEDCPRPNKDDQ